jgi:hypothetical protein
VSETATRFCGRCGSPAAAGAPFCGRCGAPLAPAPPPVYAYPPASHGLPSASRGKLGQLGLLAFGGGALAVLVIAGALIVRSIGNAPPKCQFTCTVPRGVPLAETHTYSSSQFGFQVDYPGSLTVGRTDPDAVAFREADPAGSGAEIAEITVTGVVAGKSADQLVNDAIAALASSRLQSVQQQALTINGAHVGGQLGVGRIYDANLFGQGQPTRHVRVAVIAATRGGNAVVVTAIENANTASRDRSGILDPATIDYMMSEFRWSGEQ